MTDSASSSSTAAPTPPQPTHSNSSMDASITNALIIETMLNYLFLASKIHFHPEKWPKMNFLNLIEPQFDNH